jgi:rhamnulokinase
MPCTKLGPVLPEVAAETGLSASTNIVAVGGHDTASAIAAVPAIGNSHAYLSSGTWSLMGVESDQPVVTDRSFEYGFTNEGGLGGKIRLLKNITGLWLVQECRRIWNEDGAKLSFTDLGKLAKDVEPFTAFINPDDPTFAEPGDMPKRICEYCERTGQPVPQTRGTIIRVALESLAFRYRTVFNMLEDLIGKRIDTLHIVGGGIQEKTLNQLTANAINRNVIAGPIEATALGNVMAQMMADGTVDTLEAGREIIRASCETELYEARNVADFDAAYQRYKDITKA